MKAKRKLRRLSAGNLDEEKFAQWRELTYDRMAKANVAALMFSVFPILPLILALIASAIPGGEGAVVFIMFVSTMVFLFGSLIIAFLSARAGGQADVLAKDLSLQKGVGWLAANKKVKKSNSSPPKLD